MNRIIRRRSLSLHAQ